MLDNEAFYSFLSQNAFICGVFRESVGLKTFWECTKMEKMTGAFEFGL